MFRLDGEGVGGCLGWMVRGLGLGGMVFRLDGEGVRAVDREGCVVSHKIVLTQPPCYSIIIIFQTYHTYDIIGTHTCTCTFKCISCGGFTSVTDISISMFV